MINVTLGSLSITGIGRSSGLFIGKKNTHKGFRSEHIINEVVGVLSGDENLVKNNNWVKNKQKGKVS